jgi:hypothetical protein
MDAAYMPLPEKEGAVDHIRQLLSRLKMRRGEDDCFGY